MHAARAEVLGRHLLRTFLSVARIILILLASPCTKVWGFYLCVAPSGDLLNEHFVVPWLETFWYAAHSESPVPPVWRPLLVSLAVVGESLDGSQQAARLLRLCQ